MHQHLIKKHWLDRALDVNRFHIDQLRDEPNWTIQRTADALNRSIGSISQDLTLASWAKTHDKQLRRCRSAREALQFVKDRQREQKLRID